jgi:hypothetical protein
MKRAQPRWETLAIFFAIAALWPWLLRGPLNLPDWLTWGLLAAALALMIAVFVRRARRMARLGDEPPEAPKSPQMPPGYGPPA